MAHKDNNSDSIGNNETPIVRIPMRAMIAEYDAKKQDTKAGLSRIILVKASEKNDLPITLASGSTFPLVEKPTDEEVALYDPFEHRQLSHPTSDLDTLIHLLKGSLGSGILAMPLAFKNAGLYFGLAATFIIGIICTYCIHILVKCAHKLCRKTQTPSLAFGDVAEAAFRVGPQEVQKYARLAKATVDLFIVIELIGCCCVYIVFITDNVNNIISNYVDKHWDVRIYMALCLPPLLIFAFVRNLKYLAPFSMIANCLLVLCMAITLYFIFRDTSKFQSVPAFSSVQELPLFFGTAIFALEGIGVVMPLENNMKKPNHLIGCPGVLNIGMLFVILLYCLVGFFGYLRYGADTKDSITLNLDSADPLAQSVQIMIAFAMFLTYGLQFHVPTEIIWNNLKQRFGARQLQGEYFTRVILIIFTVCVAIAVPNLGPFMSLVGAVCLSTLGLVFPSIIELVTDWEDEDGLGRFNWKLWKNIFIISFGLLGFATGSYESLQKIMVTGK